MQFSNALFDLGRVNIGNSLVAPSPHSWFFRQRARAYGNRYIEQRSSPSHGASCDSDYLGFQIDWLLRDARIRNRSQIAIRRNTRRGSIACI